MGGLHDTLYFFCFYLQGPGTTIFRIGQFSGTTFAFLIINYFLGLE